MRLQQPNTKWFMNLVVGADSLKQMLRYFLCRSEMCCTGPGLYDFTVSYMPESEHIGLVTT